MSTEVTRGESFGANIRRNAESADVHDGGVALVVVFAEECEASGELGLVVERGAAVVEQEAVPGSASGSLANALSA